MSDDSQPQDEARSQDAEVARGWEQPGAASHLPQPPGQPQPHPQQQWGQQPPAWGQQQPHQQWGMAPAGYVDYVAYRPLKNDGFAVTSLVLGICGVTIGLCTYTAPLFGLLALIFGVLGIRRIRKDPEGRTGSGLAIAGISLGSIVLVLTIILILAIVLS